MSVNIFDSPQIRKLAAPLWKTLPCTSVSALFVIDVKPTEGTFLTCTDLASSFQKISLTLDLTLVLD